MPVLYCPFSPCKTQKKEQKKINNWEKEDEKNKLGVEKRKKKERKKKMRTKKKVTALQPPIPP